MTTLKSFSRTWTVSYWKLDQMWISCSHHFSKFKQKHRFFSRVFEDIHMWYRRFCKVTEKNNCVRLVFKSFFWTIDLIKWTEPPKLHEFVRLMCEVCVTISMWSHYNHSIQYYRYCINSLLLFVRFRPITVWPQPQRTNDQNKIDRLYRTLETVLPVTQTSKMCWNKSVNIRK